MKIQYEYYEDILPKKNREQEVFSRELNIDPKELKVNPKEPKVNQKKIND